MGTIASRRPSDSRRPSSAAYRRGRSHAAPRLCTGLPWRRGLLLLALGIVLASCGGADQPEPSFGPPSAQAPVPVGAPPPIVVAVEPAPLASPPPEEEPTDGVTRVRTVAGLLRAIGPNRTIELEPGRYVLSAAESITTPYVRWEDVYDGRELVVDSVANLTIRAARAERPAILAEPRYAWVMRLTNVEHVTFANLLLGHTPEGGCTGGVLAFEQARDVHVEQSELYGSGTMGVGLTNVDGFVFERSVVRECTYGIAVLNHATNATFRESRFEDNREYDLVELIQSPEVRFERCAFARNRTAKAMGYVFFKTDARSSVVLEDSRLDDNDFDQLTNERSRLKVVGTGAATAVATALAKPSPEFNQIYALARYDRWIVAGTQAGVVFWDPAAHRVDKLVSGYITGDLQVVGRHLWAGGYRSILRFDGLTSKSYLENASAGGSRLFLTPRGTLIVQQDGLVQRPGPWWQLDPTRDRFEPIAAAGPRQAPAALGGATYSLFYGALLRRNGEAWGVDFLRGLSQTKGSQTTFLPRQSVAYPGRDPRRLYEDPGGRLWVIDFEDGFLQYDDRTGTFVRHPAVTEKASDMVIDPSRGRTWLLHYTKGPYLVEARTTQLIDLSRLAYMRALLLDRDGSVWIGGWNALVHLRPQGTHGWSEDEFVVDGSTVAPTVGP